MDREEEVGLLVVGDRGAVVERDEQVGVARQHRAAGEHPGQRGRDALRDLERGVLLLQAARADRAGLRAAVARDRSTIVSGGRPPRPRAAADSIGASRGGRARRPTSIDDAVGRRSADRSGPRALGSRNSIVAVSPAKRTAETSGSSYLLLGKGRIELRVRRSVPGSSSRRAVVEVSPRPRTAAARPASSARRGRPRPRSRRAAARRPSASRSAWRRPTLPAAPASGKRIFSKKSRGSVEGAGARGARGRRSARCAGRPAPGPCPGRAGSGGRGPSASARRCPRPPPPRSRGRGPRRRRRTPCRRSCRWGATRPSRGSSRAPRLRRQAPR